MSRRRCGASLSTGLLRPGATTFPWDNPARVVGPHQAPRLHRLHPRPAHTASGIAQWPRLLWRKSNVPFQVASPSLAQMCGSSALPQRRIFTRALGLSSAWLLFMLWSLDGGRHLWRAVWKAKQRHVPLTALEALGLVTCTSTRAATWLWALLQDLTDLHDIPVGWDPRVEHLGLWYLL